MTTVKPSTLGFELVELGALLQTEPRDSLYFCPSREWLIEFKPWLDSRRKPYLPESYDCDDYALWAVLNATLCLYESNIRGMGHTFFYCTVHIPEGATLNGIPGPSHHACNLVRLNDEHYYFFEPQSGLFTNATAALAGGVVSSLDLVWL